MSYLETTIAPKKRMSNLKIAVFTVAAVVAVAAVPVAYMQMQNSTNPSAAASGSSAPAFKITSGGTWTAQSDQPLIPTISGTITGGNIAQNGTGEVTMEHGGTTYTGYLSGAQVNGGTFTASMQGSLSGVSTSGTMTLTGSSNKFSGTAGGFTMGETLTVNGLHVQAV